MPLAITRKVSAAIASCELTHLVRQPIDVELACAQHDRYERLLEELGCRVLSLPAIKERIGIRGSVTKASTPAEFDKFVQAEAEKITKAIKDGGVKLE